MSVLWALVGCVVVGLLHGRKPPVVFCRGSFYCHCETMLCVDKVRFVVKECEFLVLYPIYGLLEVVGVFIW